MGLHVSVMAEVHLPDGTLVARATQGDYTFNPDSGNFDTEVSLAKAAASVLASQALERMDTRLDDWAAAIAQAQESEARRKEQGE